MTLLRKVFLSITPVDDSGHRLMEEAPEKAESQLVAFLNP